MLIIALCSFIIGYGLYHLLLLNKTYDRHLTGMQCVKHLLRGEYDQVRFYLRFSPIIPEEMHHLLFYMNEDDDDHWRLVADFVQLGALPVESWIYHLTSQTPRSHIQYVQLTILDPAECGLLAHRLQVLALS